MNFIEKILKESLVRIAVSDLCEPIKEKLAESVYLGRIKSPK